MSYSLGFLELFFGYLAVVSWAWWLSRQSGRPRFTRWIPHLSGVLLASGQILALLAVTSGQLAGAAASMLPLARGLAVSGIVLGLLLCGLATIAPRSSPPDRHTG